jgi:hypothetical protein
LDSRGIDGVCRGLRGIATEWCSWAIGSTSDTTNTLKFGGSRMVQGEMKAIPWYTPLPFVTCAVFTLLCARLNLHSCSAAVKLELAIWLVGPLPLLIVNALFIKLYTALTAAYFLGWLVKLLVAAVAVTLILR